MSRGRSWIAWRKASRVLRIPAGDPSDGEHDCSCGNFLLTEDSQPILTEAGVGLSPES